MLTSEPLVYPMLAMVLLTFAVLLRLFLLRSRLAKEGTIDPRYFQTYQTGEEPADSAKWARHFSNIFEPSWPANRCLLRRLDRAAVYVGPYCDRMSGVFGTHDGFPRPLIFWTLDAGRLEGSLAALNYRGSCKSFRISS